MNFSEELIKLLFTNFSQVLIISSYWMLGGCQLVRVTDILLTLKNAYLVHQ